MEAIISVLLEKFLSLLETEGRQLLEFDDEFEKTKDDLRYMQSYLKDANQVKRKGRSEVLEMAIRDLRELVYDVEDIIADFQLLLQKKCKGCAPNFMRYCSPTFFKSRCRLGKQLRKTNKKIRDMKERMITFMSTAPHPIGNEGDGSNRPLAYPILMDEAEMVGLEDDSAKIRKWILKAKGPSTVIGIVGMGGIGKTTLAQKICNSESVRNSFKYSCFVTVSQIFKFDELLKKMLRKLKVEEEPLREKDVEELLKMLRSTLDERYVVVLDDVWGTDEERWWDSLKSALPRVEGSCVIVTTRNEKVAKSMGATDKSIHCPQVLSDEDSWSLFSKVAFARNAGKCTNPNLKGLGKEIVKGCGGLPLAINIVGGMMSEKGDSIDEWRRISENLKKELANSKKDELVTSRLELSYQELPTQLKCCILCFAMFPEDFEIGDVDMIYWWIGEGFVWERDGKTAREIGEECLAELFNRFLILGADKDIFERRFETYKMHDMVRDMIIKIAREERFYVNLDSGGSPAFSDQSRRLGIVGNTVVESTGISSKLRTLVGIRIERKEMIASVKAKLCEVRWLRVLCLQLSSPRIDEDVVSNDWLSGIGSLQHLVHLYIEKSSALRTMPDSIENLHNLQILYLAKCPNLERLPVSITTLEKLTAVKIFECPSLECMPKGLGKLSNLETLIGFGPVNSVRGKNGSGISQLKKLTRLRELWMDIKSEEQIEEGELNVLSMLHHLQMLYLNFEGSFLESDALVKKIDRDLCTPLKCLRELVLGNYPGESTPEWLNPTSLPNLQFLAISGERIRKMGPRFWDRESGVWKVEFLVLYNLKEMKEEWARMRRAMPSLRLLKVQDCPKLKSFPFDVTVEDIVNIWRKEEEEGEGALYARSLLEAAPAGEVEVAAIEEEEGPEIQEISFA